jgi:hypothetical protein
MAYFQTKNPTLGKFRKALEWNVFENFMTIWNILEPFGITYGSLVQFVVIWYIFPILVCLDQEKSGNPAKDWRNLKGSVILFCLHKLAKF